MTPISMYLNEWGPIAWELFHYITYTYKPELKEYYVIFFSTLYSIIPCPHCSGDIKNILTSMENYPRRHIINKDKLIKWVINIHNSVNSKLNKAQFTKKEADIKYLNNNEITIDHDRILKFLQLSLHVKGASNTIDKDSFFKRNLIALCAIYPVGVNSYLHELMHFINYKIINNDNYKEWFDNFKEIILKNNIKEWDNIKFPIRNQIYSNEIALNHLKLFKKATNKILNKKDKLVISDYPNDNLSSIIINSKGDNKTIITKSYLVYNSINLLKIYIEGRCFSKNGHISIKSFISNSSSKMSNLKTHKISNQNVILKIEYENILENSTVNLLFDIVNKNKNDKFIIKDICLIGS